MLTREHIRSGDFLRSYRDLPGDLRWSETKIAASLADTLAQRRAEGDIHVFGYGSLIWNPAFHFAERRVATLIGWHRSFCQRLIGGRGSAETPGRMLSLEPGGHARGIAFCIPKAIAGEELRILWIREMLTGAYQPRWLDVRLDDGRQMSAITFVADFSHPLYERDSSVATVAQVLAAARGQAGPNLEYLIRLHASLLEHGIADPYVDSLVKAVMKPAPEEAPVPASRVDHADIVASRDTN